jgi:large subunit ribosomal protein L7/L12
MRALGFLFFAAGMAAYFFRESRAGDLTSVVYVLGALGIIFVLLGTFRNIGGETIDMTETPRLAPERQAPPVRHTLEHDEEPEDVSAGDFHAALEPVMEQVVHLVRKNQVIEAIKVVRQATGLGLKESKDLVDELRRRL